MFAIPNPPQVIGLGTIAKCVICLALRPRPGCHAGRGRVLSILSESVLVLSTSPRYSVFFLVACFCA